MTLDRLWAGWRGAYVAEHGAGTAESARRDGGSVFTRILASGRPDDETHIVHRGAAVFVILNRYPYGSGHLLVLSYREVADLEALTAAEHAELWATVLDAVVAVKTAYRPGGVNVGANLGEAAGAGVPDHLHVHVLPRWSADTNVMTTVAETRVLSESLPTTYARIRAAWPAR